MSSDPSPSRPGPTTRSGGRDDLTQGRDSTASGPEEPGPDANRTEVLGRQATVKRATSTGPLTRVVDTGAGSDSSRAGSGGPSTSGSLTAVRDAPRGSAAVPPVPVSGPAAQPDAMGAELGTAVVTATPTVGAGAARKARLTVSQLDPWSVMKMSFLLSLAGGIVLVVCVWLMWLLLSNGDVFVSIDRTVGDIAGSGSTVSVVELFSLRRVMGIALMLAVVQVVLVTALATLAAFLYNLAAGLVGGFEVTLSEDS